MSIGHGYDWAWAQIPSSAVTSNGGTFVVRYLGGTARLTPQERDNHFAAGVKILLVMEQEATLAEGGFTRGVAAARQANDEADFLGYPSGCTLFYADDNNDGDVSQEIDFMRGVKSVGRRPSDMYSGGNVLHALGGLSEHGGWMVDTWYPNAGADPCMIQLANTREPAMVGIDPSQYDTNLLMKQIPMWSAAGQTLGSTFTMSDMDTLGQWLKDTEGRIESTIGQWLKDVEGRIEKHVDATIASTIAALPASTGGGPKLADIQKAVHVELEKLTQTVKP